MPQTLALTALLLIAPIAGANSYHRFESLAEQIAMATCVAVVDADGRVQRVLYGTPREHIDVPPPGCEGQRRIATVIPWNVLSGEKLVPGERVEARCLDVVDDVARTIEHLPPWTPSASGFDVIAVPNAFTAEAAKRLTISFGYRNRTTHALVVPILWRGGVTWSVVVRDEGGDVFITRLPREDPAPSMNPIKEELNTFNTAFRVDPGFAMFWFIGEPLMLARPGRYTIEVTAHRLNGTEAVAAPFVVEITSPVAPRP